MIILTKKMTTNAETTIIKNWEIFKTQANKLQKSKSEKIATFLEAIEEDMMETPASTKFDLVCSYPGGLVEHSLRVLSYMAKLRKVYDLEQNLPSDSIILTALFHDVGKIGVESKPYYIHQQDQWKREKLGQNYEINEKLSGMPISQLSLRWLTNYNFKLELDEWQAISSIRDHHKDDLPSKGESMLAVILQQAVKVALMKGKNKKEVTLITG